MVPTRQVELAALWTELFLTIANIKNHVQREREIDPKFTVILSDFPRITQNICIVTQMLVEEVGGEKFYLDGPCIEYFIQNDLAATLVSLAMDDQPLGLLSLVIGFYTAILSTLPPKFFINEKVSAPLLRRLIPALPSLLHSNEALKDKIIGLLEQLTIQTTNYPMLVNVFAAYEGSSENLHLLLQYLVEGHTLNESIKGIIIRGFNSGLLQSPCCDCLLVSITFCLVKSFTSECSENFLDHLKFLNHILQVAQNDPQVPSQLISNYRDFFVNRIFAVTLSGSSASDGSTSRLLDMIIKVCRASSESLDLFIPLMSRTVRILEKIPDADVDFEQVKLLYVEGLCTKSLARCFPNKKPTHWTESINIHRRRLDSLLSWLPTIGLPSFSNAEVVSNLYRIHLMTIDKLLGDEIFIQATEQPSTTTPLITVTNFSLDPGKNTKLFRLMADSKVDLTRYWSRSVKENLMTLRLLAGCLAFLDPQEFYPEFEDLNPTGLSATLRQTIQKSPNIIAEENIVSSMFRIHMQYDALESTKWWDSPLFVKEDHPTINRTGNAYLLGHFLMRMAAISHVRATRSFVSIVYD